MAPSHRTRMTRLRDKRSIDRDALDALFDDVVIGTFALTEDGLPRAIPTAVVRDGDSVLAHGSTGSRWMRLLADGASTCLSVTAVDGIVVARSAFESSFRYRSAVLFGTCSTVDGSAKPAALELITERLIPGRTAEVRPSTTRELDATLVLRFPIEDWSLKVSRGWPEDPADDVAGDAWAGVVPITNGFGPAAPAPDLRSGIGVPRSVRALGAIGDGDSDAATGHS